MRHRHGTALGNLPLEERNHAAGRAEHVPEAHRHEARRVPGAAGIRLKDDFGEALGRAHRVRRVDRLVRGNQHEGVRSVIRGEFEQPRRAERVVLDRLAGLAFHHRHVLVRRRMKNEFRAKFFENLLHALAVRDVRDQRNDDAAESAPNQILLDLVKQHFALFDEQQLRGSARRDLAANFAPDGAARSRDHHAPPEKHVHDGGTVKMRRRPIQQIFERDFPHVRNDGAPGHQIFDAGNALDVEPGLLRELRHLAGTAHARRRRGQNQLRHAVAVAQRGQIVRRGKNGKSHDQHSVFFRIVVDEEHRFFSETRTRLERRRQTGTGVARAENRDARPRRFFRRVARLFLALPQQPRADADGADREQREEIIDDQRARVNAGIDDVEAQQHETRAEKHHGEADRHGDADARQLRNAEISENASEPAGKIQRRQLQRNDAERDERNAGTDVLGNAFRKSGENPAAVGTQEKFEFVGKPQHDRQQHGEKRAAFQVSAPAVPAAQQQGIPRMHVSRFSRHNPPVSGEGGFRLVVKMSFLSHGLKQSSGFYRDSSAFFKEKARRLTDSPFARILCGNASFSCSACCNAISENCAGAGSPFPRSRRRRRSR